MGRTWPSVGPVATVLAFPLIGDIPSSTVALGLLVRYAGPMTEHEALRSLLVDRNEVDEGRLASALQGRVHLDELTGEVVTMEPFDTLKSHDRVLCVLLGRLAAEILALPNAGPVSPKDLIAMTGMRSGTVYPALRSLTESHLAAQDDEGRYFVPRSRVLAAIGTLPQGNP